MIDNVKETSRFAGISNLSAVCCRGLGEIDYWDGVEIIIFIIIIVVDSYCIILRGGGSDSGCIIDWCRNLLRSRPKKHPMVTIIFIIHFKMKSNKWTMTTAATMRVGAVTMGRIMKRRCCGIIPKSGHVVFLTTTLLLEWLFRSLMMIFLVAINPIMGFPIAATTPVI